MSFNTNRIHGEDWQFNIEFLSYASSICFVNELLYQYYHRSRNSLVNKYRDNYLELKLESREYFERILPQFDWKSDGKMNEVLCIPFESFIYYKKYLNGIDLENKLRNMYTNQYLNQIYCAIFEDGYKPKNDFYIELYNAIKQHSYSLYKNVLIRATFKERLRWRVKKICKIILGRK